MAKGTGLFCCNRLTVSHNVCADFFTDGIYILCSFTIVKVDMVIGVGCENSSVTFP